MTAGSEEVCIDVVRKVEIEEKCVAGLDINDLKEVGAVASSVGGNGNLNGDGKEDTDDSSYVFVTGSIEVSAVDPDDTLGVKSDSVYEIEQFKKEELGIENGEMSFDPLVLETNGVLHESATVTDAEVKVDKGDVNLENESTVDPSIVVDTDLIAKDVNGHLDKITVEEGEVVRSTEELQDVNGITNGEAKPGDVVPEFSVDSESTLNPIESSQVTAFELESTVKPSEESKSQVEQMVESEANLVKSDSAYEVGAADPDDTGGVKSDSAYEIEQFKKEELGIENREMSFDPLVLETNGVLHESATVTDAEVKVDKGDVNLENESTVDPSVVVDTDLIAKDVNGHLDKITVEEGEVVRSTEELQDVNGITNGEAKPGDVVPEFSFDSESTLNPIESSQVTAFELESTVKPSGESKSQVEQRVESEANLVKSDSAYEVGAADPDDTGGVKFDSAYEIEQFKKEELGIENREMSFDPLVLETNGVVANGNIKPSWGEESDNLEQNVDASRGEINRDKMSFPEVEDIDDTQSDEIPTSSVEGSVSDAIDTQNEETEVLAYNFLIRIPRFEDESFRDQIRSAQLLVEEKTSLRDAIRVDIQGKRARLRAHNETYNAAKLEETAARRLVRLKRQEIDSVQIVINRWKNAMSVEDIDARILNTEYMIQHETLDLKDEKQFIREIKQLKTLRDQLASNMGTEEEIRQAIDQKDHNEDRMKILRKELDSLKDKVSKAEAVVKAVGKKYDEESRKERELQAQFRVADDVRQKAYAHLNSVKKLSYDKNKNFRMYKEDAMAARDFVSRGDKDALHRLCANQVEAFMEQWNNNDEFRKEYVSRCSMNANRRQKAFEGSSLVPDDVASVVPSKVNSTVDRSLISIPVEVKTVSMGSAGEQGNIVSIPVEVKSIANLSAQKNQILKTKGPAKPTLGNDVPMVAELTVVTEAIDKKEEENTVTKEELEMAKRDEELKKAEIEAKLREQRRLEEKAKAIEALERKKRNAEKAQLKAELRARKEVEQKEKEREKRLRKKEKKKVGGGDSSINGEEAASSESSNEATTKETEPIKENNIRKKTQKPPAHFFSKQLKPKPIPPPLINRNKKRWQQYGKFALAVVAILALFFVGNTGFFTKLKGTKSAGPI